MRKCTKSEKSVIKVKKDWDSVAKGDSRLKVEKVEKNLWMYEKVCLKLRKCSIDWKSALKFEKVGKQLSKLTENEKEWKNVVR